MRRPSDSVVIIMALAALLIAWAGYGPVSRWAGNLLSPSAAVTAPCVFGERTYTVRLVTEGGSQSLGRVSRRNEHRGWFMGLTPGDHIRVDTGRGGGGFSALYGQPVHVDGEWYDVRLSRDRRTFTAESLGLDTAHIVVSHQNWTALLVGETHLMSVGGTNEPIALPADRYFIYDYRQHSRPGDRGAVLHVASYRVSLNEVPRFEARAGETLRLDIGTPLTARVSASAHPGREGIIYLSLALTDAGERRVDSVSVTAGRRPPAPKVRLHDRDGAEVYAATLEYG